MLLHLTVRHLLRTMLSSPQAAKGLRERGRERGCRLTMRTQTMQRESPSYRAAVHDTRKGVHLNVGTNLIRQWRIARCSVFSVFPFVIRMAEWARDVCSKQTNHLSINGIATWYYWGRARRQRHSRKDSTGSSDATESIGLHIVEVRTCAANASEQGKHFAGPRGSPSFTPQAQPSAPAETSNQYLDPMLVVQTICACCQFNEGSAHKIYHEERDPFSPLDRPPSTETSSADIC